MNLEQLLSRFESVASRLAKNNSEQEQINDSLYKKDYHGKVCGDGCEVDPDSEYGIIVSLEKVLNYIENLADQQSENISKISGFIYSENIKSKN